MIGHALSDFAGYPAFFLAEYRISGRIIQQCRISGPAGYSAQPNTKVGDGSNYNAKHKKTRVKAWLKSLQIAYSLRKITNFRTYLFIKLLLPYTLFLVYLKLTETLNEVYKRRK